MAKLIAHCQDDMLPTSTVPNWFLVSFKYLQQYLVYEARSKKATDFFSKSTKLAYSKKSIMS